jgi:MFS family permease
VRTFYAVVANTLASFLANTFVWFAVTLWVYLETESVIATSVMAGVYTISVAFSGFYLGSLVDRHPKKRVMLLSSLCSLILYTLALAIFVPTPRAVFADASSVTLWIFVVLTLLGAVVGNVRAIVLSTPSTLRRAHMRSTATTTRRPTACSTATPSHRCGSFVSASARRTGSGDVQCSRRGDHWRRERGS